MIRQLVKSVIPAPVFRVVEPYGHWGEAILMQALHGWPARNLKVIGVTGTDGKTTTATLIYTMMQQAGYKVGLATTIAIGAGELQPNATRLTVMTSGDLLRAIKTMRREQIEWLVLEITSHALAEHRADGIPFSVGVLTNVSHEHLDYHRTFERYRAAKLRLFKLVARNRRGLRTGVVNADDPSGALFAAAVPQALSYGIKAGDLRAEQIHSTPSGSSYYARYQDRRLKIETHLPGGFNVSNSLAAVGVGLAIGLSDEQIEQGIAALESVEGRMNRVDEGQDFNVIVDYAHTPDSFAKVFAELKPVTKGRLIAVFGSAGRRDEAKRPKQGEIAGQYCDIVVVTEEDDRDQDGQEILEQIAAGAEAAGKQREQDLFLIHDRTRAIGRAIGMAEPGDTVMLLGKGHERSILTNQGKLPWDEVATARAALRARAKSVQKRV